jgi:hypothetical protein
VEDWVRKARDEVAPLQRVQRSPGRETTSSKH